MGETLPHEYELWLCSSTDSMDLTPSVLGDEGHSRERTRRPRSNALSPHSLEAKKVRARNLVL